ncbi:PREDICTED: decaprenyl-diphosphate synthase subunit 2-like [Priapulus caudatus]|uniref:Decaprenyl-diphosphate synthase subunit 2-like n=1 Tax=Priapulus caudatus TaxID=37621 RepID=A0ABM1DTX0_PRICU|nr:PREDICTED: decaprenyl-diphosphate synthase subunit 2-like [Priapulus caudatus]
MCCLGGKAVSALRQWPYVSTCLRPLSLTLERHVHPTSAYFTSRRPLSLWGSSKTDDWNKAMSEAEKIVGYPTSYLSLRCLLSDEMSNVALHVRRLVGTKHPLLQTAKHLIYDGKNGLQTRGLIVLLMAKTAGRPSSDGYDKDLSNQQQQVNDASSGITERQRQLAEITEVIHTAYLIHKGVVNLDGLQAADGSCRDMEFGNKMAILSGDFLLASACRGLASLRNTKVVEMISTSIGHMMEAEFALSRDRLNNPLPSLDITIDTWQQTTFNASASLVANSCQSAVALVGHGEEVQTHAYEYGKNMGFAHQLHLDLQSFEEDDCGPASLHSAPTVFLQLESAGSSLLNQLCKVTEASAFNYRELKKQVSVSGALEKTKELRNFYSQRALNALNQFSKSDASRSLESIIKVMSNS